MTSPSRTAVARRGVKTLSVFSGFLIRITRRTSAVTPVVFGVPLACHNGISAFGITSSRRKPVGVVRPRRPFVASLNGILNPGRRTPSTSTLDPQERSSRNFWRAEDSPKIFPEYFREIRDIYRSLWGLKIYTRSSIRCTEPCVYRGNFRK